MDFPSFLHKEDFRSIDRRDAPRLWSSIVNIFQVTTYQQKAPSKCRKTKDEHMKEGSKSQVDGHNGEDGHNFQMRTSVASLQIKMLVNVSKKIQQTRSQTH
eukprot:TRINITY_DN14934_c0_g2_i1.p1 TRINITY_DN14934_c0_g2~~TRINITY_DN14934_c0_g2_i1.p1  ORF type:complete len:101 (+),score=7.87 TRINITY_DN14934_c0_g2_i1:1415-1717(+)